MAFVSWPPMSSTVRVPREHRVRAEAVAEDLGLDLPLGERQALPAVAGADRSDLLERQGRDPIDAARRVRTVAVARRGRAPPACASSKRAGGLGGVLDVENRLVEQPDELVVADAGVPALRSRPASCSGCRRDRGRSRSCGALPSPKSSGISPPSRAAMRRGTLGSDRAAGQAAAGRRTDRARG